MNDYQQTRPRIILAVILLLLPVSWLLFKTKAQQNSPQNSQEVHELLNRIDIVFYGSVMDQFGNALGNTKVNYSYDAADKFFGNLQKGELVADASGYFTITGIKGKSLGVKPERPGYALAMTNTGFIYSHFWRKEQRHIPDATNPVIFTMWKLQGGEPLIRLDQTIRFNPSQSPIFWDITLAKQVSTGGDLRITIQRSPGVMSLSNRLSWVFEIEPVGGGIIEIDRPQLLNTFFAPSEGYQSKYAIKLDHEIGTWSEGFQKVFFMKSRSGQVFSKFQLWCNINLTTEGLATVRLKEGLANSNSSRNWEEDPKLIKAPGE